MQSHENADSEYSQGISPVNTNPDNYRFVRPLTSPTSRARAEGPIEHQFVPIAVNIAEMLESIVSEDSEQEETSLGPLPCTSGSSQTQQSGAQRQQLQQQQQQQQTQTQTHQQRLELDAHRQYQPHQQQQQQQQQQPNIATQRQIPRSTECSDTESFPMDEPNAPAATLPGSEPEAIQDFAMANDLEEHAYRLINSSRKVARRLREARNENDWPRQTRQSSSSSGLGLRRDSIGGLSTHSQPLVGAGANYSSLGLQSPAPSYRSQGNYAPGVASAVVADMREVLRVREEGMAEHLKLVVTQELLPLQQQMNRMQNDIAEMKRDIQTMRSATQGCSGRLESLECEVKSLSGGSNVLQSQLMALSMRVIEGGSNYSASPMVNYYHPSLNVTQHLQQHAFQVRQQQQQRADEQQQQQQLPQAHSCFSPGQHQPLAQHCEYEPQHTELQPPPVQYSQRQNPTQLRPLSQHRLTPQSVNAGSSGISPRVTNARPTSMQLQRGDIRHIDANVFGETVANLPAHTNGTAGSDYSDVSPEYAPSPLVDLELREVELRRELQDALASKMQHQTRIDKLQHTLHLVSQERNGAPLRVRTATATRTSIESGQQQQQQQQHGEDVATTISGIGPVTDL